nr:MAG TPA: hypothetical protein [Bacteriophage sp.]
MLESNIRNKAFPCTGYPIGHFPVGCTIYNSLTQVRSSFKKKSL